MHFLTAGDMLRWHIRQGTPLGKEADAVIRAGGLMPDKTMMALVSHRLHEMRDKDWILDGFPRTDGQAQLLTEDLACLLYTSPSPRDKRQSRMPSSA